MDELISIGFLAKPHGLKGHNSATVSDRVLDVFQQFKTVFIDMSGTKVPFRLESAEPLNGGKFKVKISGTNTVSDAEKFRGKEIFQLESLLPKDESWSPVGFVVHDVNNSVIGEITDFQENQHQTLLLVKNGEQEFYIPLVEDWIIKVDAKKKILKLDLPEGLLEL